MLCIKYNQISTSKLLLNYCNPNLIINTKTRSGIFREQNYLKELILYGSMDMFKILVPYTSLDNLYKGLKLIEKFYSNKFINLKRVKKSIIKDQITFIKNILHNLFSYDLLNIIVNFL